MKFRISQGQAIRSVFGRSLVTHFMLGTLARRDRGGSHMNKVLEFRLESGLSTVTSSAMLAADGVGRAPDLRSCRRGRDPRLDYGAHRRRGRTRRLDGWV